jgi:hypothetical protein
VVNQNRDGNRTARIRGILEARALLERTTILSDAVSFNCPAADEIQLKFET